MVFQLNVPTLFLDNDGVNGFNIITSDSYGRFYLCKKKHLSIPFGQVKVFHKIVPTLIHLGNNQHQKMGCEFGKTFKASITFSTPKPELIMLRSLLLNW